MQSKDTIYYMWHVTIVNVFTAKKIIYKKIYIFVSRQIFVELELKKNKKFN